MSRAGVVDFEALTAHFSQADRVATDVFPENPSPGPCDSAPNVVLSGHRSGGIQKRFRNRSDGIGGHRTTRTRFAATNLQVHNQKPYGRFRSKAVKISQITPIPQQIRLIYMTMFIKSILTVAVLSVSLLGVPEQGKAAAELPFS
jgi:hypothetical protein